MLTENDERLPLTSASFRSGLQGRRLRHETSLVHPNAPTQIAPAESAGNGEQNLHFRTSFDADLLCRLGIHGEKQYARGQQNLAQLPRWDAEAGSCGILSKEAVSGFLFWQGLKFSGSLVERQDTAGQLPGGIVPLWEAASPSHGWGSVGLCHFWFGRKHVHLCAMLHLLCLQPSL